jgi:hypothetical protein
MRWLRALLLGLLLLLALPATARAHESVFTLKYVDGENIVIASYNVHEFTAGQPITFNLRVYSISGVPVVYSNVEAVVEQHDEVVLDRTMPASSYSDVDWVYAFERGGDYGLTLRFTDQDAPTAQAHFPIDVADAPIHGAPSGTEPLTSRILAWPTGAALLLGIGLTLLVQRLSNRPAGGTRRGPNRADGVVEPAALTEVS